MLMMYQNIKNDQRGLASFVITFFIMMVLGLIVIGFAQITRRDQRQSLDRQLSTQAYYAAEVGVNDATKYVQTHFNPTTDKKDNCSEAAPGQLLAGYSREVGGAGSGVSYTCLLINLAPGDLQKDPVAMNTNVVFPVQVSAGTAITDITFKWSRSASPAPLAGTCSTAGSYVSGSSCSIPVLRGDIVSYGTTSLPSRDNLINGMYSFYAAPTTGAGAASYAYASQSGGNPENIRGDCNGSGECTATITIAGGADRYYVRLSSVYGTSKVAISANSNSPLIGAQAVIDSTGKAGDVLKRIQVRIPITGTQGIPGFALQTGDDQCKRFGVIPSPAQVFNIGSTLSTECALN